MGNTGKQCRLGLCQDSDFAGDLEDSKSTSGGTLCLFGRYTFVPISWMCKKQTAVSHSSTESEIISLDTGLRLDGLPALELWDLIVSVFGSVSQISDRTGQPVNVDIKSALVANLDRHAHHLIRTLIECLSQEFIDNLRECLDASRACVDILRQSLYISGPCDASHECLPVWMNLRSGLFLKKKITDELRRINPSNESTAKRCKKKLPATRGLMQTC